MNIIQTIILSIVEGVTEFLPVSSTGHLILVSNLLHIAQANFVKSFEIAIQLGAILAVVGMYWRKLFKNWAVIFVGFLPAAVVGLVAYPFIKQNLIGNTTVVLWSLFLGGLVLLFVDRIPSGKGTLNIRNALVIGLFQSVSVIPGVSRAASTIVGGLLVGLDRKSAVEFSFLLAVPTMFAATGLDLVKSGWAFSSSEWLLLLIGFVGSLVTAWLSVKFFLNFIKSHNFFWFGLYRVGIAAIFFLTNWLIFS